MSEKKESKKLESERADALSEIHDERSAFEAMLQRARMAGENIQESLVLDVLGNFDRIAETARTAQSIDEVRSASDDADYQGQLRAYLCPVDEIEDEGISCIDVMEAWNVPPAVIEKMRRTHLPRLRDAKEHLGTARSALRTILEEHDSWDRYTSYHEKRMQFYSWVLFGAMVILTIASFFCFIYPSWMIAGFVFSGAVGACASVFSKMPLLAVSSSGELESYVARILGRVSVGVVASIIGSGLLGWGVVSIKIGTETFNDAIASCCKTSSTPCNVVNLLILFTVPMLFGFSERGLVSFERQLFGQKE
jgi:hypothetical protein